jgi:hypothetical protein
MGREERRVVEVPRVAVDQPADEPEAADQCSVGL